MTVDHLNIVRAVHDEEPPNNTSLEALLNFVLRVLQALPASERAGLLRKDGGENIALYAPAGVNVSISRICYPDGTIYKILTDAGVGGSNGPGWAENGVVDTKLYIQVGTVIPPEPPHGDHGYDDGQVVAWVQQIEHLTKDVGILAVFTARMQFDARDLGYGKAREKQLRELKQALGLP